MEVGNVDGFLYICFAKYFACGLNYSQERLWGAGLDSRGGNDKKDFSEAQGDSCSTSLKDLR